jgi:hypothetical protein
MYDAVQPGRCRRTSGSFGLAASVGCSPLNATIVRQTSHLRGIMEANREPLLLRIEHFRRLVPECWSSKTSSLWTADNPARGQCSVTALVAQHLFGGELLKTSVGGQDHFYNRFEGQVVDFTASQFATLPEYFHLPASVDEAFADTDHQQFEALLAAVAKAMPANAAEPKGV